LTLPLRPAHASGQARAREAASHLTSLVNDERAVHGLATYLIADALAAIAHVRAGELQFGLSHDRPTGTLEDLLDDAGVAWRLLGENVARIEGGASAEAATRAHRQFMRRDAHAANILSPDFVYFGVDAAAWEALQSAESKEQFVLGLPSPALVVKKKKV